MNNKNQKLKEIFGYVNIATFILSVVCFIVGFFFMEENVLVMGIGMGGLVLYIILTSVYRSVYPDASGDNEENKDQ